ncbi:MAG: MFS transporter [Nitrospirae bacterium]|nr:MFS transporter [Nitrospirota bacterium]MCL5422821.1 MFS transporter [Nitrospirota bacterium]
MKEILGFPRNVFVLGLVSLFMDISSEMIYPLIPLYLNNVLHSSKTSIGIIEGIAESTASILKVFSGWLSDRLGKRKALIFWGYGISVFSRPILATATSWMHVLIYRFTDRVGKGVRTAPRDAIIADSTRKEILGKAFGFHRSMDTVGAMIGPGIAFALLGVFHDSLQTVFWISMIPGAFAILTIALFVKDVKGSRGAEKPKISLKGFDRKFKAFLFIVAIFTLGKTSDAFLVLRAQDLGVRTGLIPALYLVFNLVSASLSTPAGIMADRVGKRRVILVSYILFSLIFVGFAYATNEIHAWILFGIYGIFVAINEGVQRAYVATIIKPEIKGTGYGIYHTIIGLAALPSSIIGGALWQNIGPQALFFYGAAMSLLSCVLFAPMIFSKK